MVYTGALVVDDDCVINENGQYYIRTVDENVCVRYFGKRAFQWRAVIVITHDKDTASAAKRRFILDNGKLHT